MREKTKAYAAGLMDAEGCFSIYKAFLRTDGKTQYQPRVVLSSIDLPVIKWLVKTFGGFFTKVTPIKGRIWYQWNLSGRTNAPSFLSNIVPYLRIKKQEAKILEEFFSLGSVQCPEKRQILMDQIRALKNRECVTTDTLDGDFKDKQTHAYMAGIIDGEGCISAAYTKSGKPMLRIRVGNNFFPLISFLQRTYGGWYHTKPAFDNTKEFYTWELTGVQARETFLLCTLPYLRIKRKQASLALQLVRVPKSSPRVVRKDLCDKIRLLNSPKIQSDLTGDRESAPPEMATA